ncbi:MAG: hypothetical protein ABJE66_32210 [Deltaproteobacteria bacterium]
MVARSASATFVPADKPRIAIASDGTLAAIHEPTRITVVDLPGCAAFAEVGIDPEAGASEVMWVGAPPRLVVLSRYAAHSTVHLLDPYGPRTIAEIRLEAPMKLMASVGAHALAVGSLGAAILTAGESSLTPYQFPARTVPVTAGAAGAQFVVALSGAIEEWDPQTRMPKRRLKLPKPAVITQLGGSDRVVWMTTQSDPTRLDVFPLVNRGQPKLHELPEPIAHVAAHPRSDLLACVGADHGRLYIVDLDGRQPIRTIAPERIDRVEAAGFILGRMIGVVAAQARRPIALIQLDGREQDAAVAMPATLPLPREDAPEPAAKSSLYDETEAVREVPTAVTLMNHLAAVAPALAAAVGSDDPAKPSLFRPAAPAPAAPARPAPAKPAAPAVSLTERFSTWRDRMRLAQPRATDPVTPAQIDTRPPWRDAVATWARGIMTGAVDHKPGPLQWLVSIAARFELADHVMPGLALLYGAHLAGEAGVAPVELARVLGRDWDEALGRGQLAASAIATYRDSRVRLATPVLRALDELPPATGVLVGQPGQVVLLSACVVVAAADQPLGVVAEATLPAAGGAILAAHPGSDPRDVALEARAYGAVAMVRVTPATVDRIPHDGPVILVLDDEGLADHLELPRL